jgi:four helix bundle protein
MTNNQAPMTNEEHRGARVRRAFDLAERTAVFGESVVRFAKSIRRDAVTSPLVSQLIRSATSIGANYLEADEAGSRKEFKYRISVCRRDARETQHWLRMIVAANADATEPARAIWQEAKELVLIFESIHRNSIAGPK